MADLRSRVKDVKREQLEVREQVRSEQVLPTRQEKEIAENVVSKLAEGVAERIGLMEAADEDTLRKAIDDECEKLDLPYRDRMRVNQLVSLTVLGNGPIEKYMRDPEVTEIVVQRFDNVAYERNGRVYHSDIVFDDEKHLRTIINRIVQRTGRQINLMTPIVDARLTDGSRVNATIPPVTPDGATLTIRKFSTRALSAADYVRLGSANEKMLRFLALCVEGKANVFVSGGTGTGKTTLLNMLSRYVPEDELIITIEDTLELKLQQPNVRREEVRPSTSRDMMQVDQKALVKAALRQRPDRIILGEVRDGSIVELVSAASTGHDGTMTSIHANSPRNMCDIRIPILFSMNADTSFSERSIAMQIAESVQIIVQISRFPDGSRKLTQITEVIGVNKNGKVDLRDIFVYDRETEEFAATGYVPELTMKKTENYGVCIPRTLFTKPEERAEGTARARKTASGQNGEQAHVQLTAREEIPARETGRAREDGRRTLKMPEPRPRQDEAVRRKREGGEIPESLTSASDSQNLPEIKYVFDDMSKDEPDGTENQNEDGKGGDDA